MRPASQTARRASCRKISKAPRASRRPASYAALKNLRKFPGSMQNLDTLKKMLQVLGYEVSHWTR